MGANPNTPINDDELLDAVARTARRLSRELDALDEGDLSGADGISTVLRTLIGEGTGYGGIKRLADLAGVRPPRVRVSAKPEKRPHLALSVGHLPIGRGPTEDPPGAVEMNFQAWISSDSLLTPGGLRKTASWTYFAHQTGNTTGSHISTTIPKLLETSQVFGASGLTLERYLLRQVGWQVERVAEEMLSQIGHPVEVHDRTVAVFGSTIMLMALARPSENAVNMGVGFRLAEFPADIFSFEFHGTHTWGVDATGHLKYTAPPGFLGPGT